MSTAFLRVLLGPCYAACQRWWVRDVARIAEVTALATEIGAAPNRRLSRGACLEGFYRPGAPPKGWRAAGKTLPGFIKPNKRTATGAAFQARVDAIKLETSESLAAELELPPFFHDLTGGWCTAVGCFMLGGNFYLELPAQLVHNLLKYHGVEKILDWEHAKARADSRAAPR